jgi:hypothetical protein
MSRLFAWFSSGGDSVSVNDDDGVNSDDEYSSNDDGEEEEEVYASNREDDDNSSATGQDEKIIDHASVHHDDLDDGVDMTTANSDMTLIELKNVAQIIIAPMHNHHRHVLLMRLPRWR